MNYRVLKDRLGYVVKSRIDLTLNALLWIMLGFFIGYFLNLSR